MMKAVVLARVTGAQRGGQRRHLAAAMAACSVPARGHDFGDGDSVESER